MLKVEIDIADVSEEGMEEVRDIILGATTGLQHYSGVKFKLSDGDEIITAESPVK